MPTVITRAMQSPGVTVRAGSPATIGRRQPTPAAFCRPETIRRAAERRALAATADRLKGLPAEVSRRLVNRINTAIARG